MGYHQVQGSHHKVNAASQSIGALPRCPNRPKRSSGGIRPRLAVLSKYCVGAGWYPSALRLYRSMRIPATTRRNVTPRAMARPMSTTNPNFMRPPRYHVSKTIFHSLAGIIRSPDDSKLIMFLENSCERLPGPLPDVERMKGMKLLPS